MTVLFAWMQPYNEKNVAYQRVSIVYTQFARVLSAPSKYGGKEILLGEVLIWECHPYKCYLHFCNNICNNANVGVSQMEWQRLVWE